MTTARAAISARTAPPSEGIDDLAVEGRNVAIGLMAFGMLLIPAMDVVAKQLTMDGMPGTQVALARFVSQGVLSLLLLPLVNAMAARRAIGAARGAPTALARAHDDLRAAATWTNAARGIALAAATAFFFTGLRTLPLPASAAILFLAPLILTVLAVFSLGERVSAARLGLCVAGFPCVLLIVRPGLGGLGWDALHPLAAALCFALYFLLTRLAVGQGSAMAMHVAAAASGTAVLALWLLAVGMAGDAPALVWPDDARTWLALLSLGAISTVAHMAIIAALARAPASVLAPLGYLEIVSATALAFFAFGTLPDAWTVAGGSLIMAIGYAVTRVRD